MMKKYIKIKIVDIRLKTIYTCRFVQILYKLGKNAVLSIVDVMLGGCFGFEGK